MKRRKKDKGLDELISQAISREKPEFDFDKWKAKHEREIQIFESQTADKQITQPGQPFNVWRIIMKSKIAAGALITIGVIIGISYFEGSSEFNQAAWGRMLESMKKMSWVYVSKKIEPPILYNAIKRWRCFDPSIEIYEYSDGTITYADYSKGHAYYYNPKDNTVTTSPVSEKYNVPGPKSPFEIVTGFFEMANERGAEIKHKYSKVDNKKVEIIESEYVTGLGKCHTRMIRDIEKNLLISSQTTILKPDTNQKITTVTTYDYPESGPRDIYEAGAPRGAKVIDRRSSENVQKLLNEVQRRYDQGYGDCIAMVLQSWIDENGTQEPWSIIMFRQQGQLHRMDLYFASDIKRFESLYDYIKDDWPNLTIEQVQKYERNDATERQVIYDGKYTTNCFRMSRDKVQSNRRKGIMPLGYGDSINSLSWFEPPIYGLSKPFFEAKYELLDSDPEHEGLIGLRITKSSTSMARNMAKSSKSDLVRKDPVWTSSDISCYWLDPSRDYLVIEHTETTAGRRTKNVTLQTKQTPSGRWYPSHIRHEYTYPLPEGRQKINRIDKRIVLDTEPVFPEGIFQADYIFNPK